MSTIISNNSELEVLARRIYGEAAELYRQVSPRLGAYALGYKILYGPPQVGVQVLFVGSQPGGNVNDALEGEIAGERRTWPIQFEYCVSSWHLARCARQIWPPELLKFSSAINMNFFRAPNEKSWNLIDQEVRREIEAFCSERARELVVAHRPKEIIVIGVSLFDRLKDRRVPTEIHMYSESLRGRLNRLVVEGEIMGIPAKGVKHLTGQYTTELDRAKIREFFNNSST